MALTKIQKRTCFARLLLGILGLLKSEPWWLWVLSYWLLLALLKLIFNKKTAKEQFKS
jgi:apolipoprotein N-acyltransferase